MLGFLKKDCLPCALDLKPYTFFLCVYLRPKKRDVDMEKEISEKRAAFLAKDYSRGFIKYCRFEADDVRRGYFQSKVKIRL